MNNVLLRFFIFWDMNLDFGMNFEYHTRERYRFFDRQ